MSSFSKCCTVICVLGKRKLFMCLFSFIVNMHNTNLKFTNTLAFSKVIATIFFEK